MTAPNFRYQDMEDRNRENQNTNNAHLSEQPYW